MYKYINHSYQLGWLSNKVTISSTYSNRNLQSNSWIWSFDLSSSENFPLSPVKLSPSKSGRWLPSGSCNSIKLSSREKELLKNCNKPWKNRSGLLRESWHDQRERGDGDVRPLRQHSWMEWEEGEEPDVSGCSNPIFQDGMTLSNSHQLTLTMSPSAHTHTRTHFHQLVCGCDCHTLSILSVSVFTQSPLCSSLQSFWQEKRH